MLEPTYPQQAILKSTAQYNLFMAGNGSGKTATMAMLSMFFVGNFPTVRGFIGANTHDQLNRATLFRIREVWKHEFNVSEYSDKTGEGIYVVGKKPPSHFSTEGHNFDSYNAIISFQNGAVIYIGSLENYKALDGIEIGWGMLDETKDTREDALKEVILGRLRQSGIYVKDGTFSFSPIESTSVMPLYIFTAPAKVTWLNDMFQLDYFESEISQKIFNKKTFFDRTFLKGGVKKKVVIASTYSNKKNLPENYIDNLLSMLPTHLIESKIYGSPFTRSGGEFYIHFDRNKTIKDFEYDPMLPLHISFDENYVPYAPCGIFQTDGKSIAMIDEVCLKEPRNNIYEVCNEIKNKYHGHSSGMFIYGDSTSMKGDPKIKRGEGKPNLYSIIRKELEVFKPILRIPTINPSVVLRGMFLNSIFEKSIFDIELFIHSKCANTINDLVYLKQDSDGGKLKVRETDKNTKQSYEKYGHMSDLLDYFIIMYNKKEYSEFTKPINNGKPAAVSMVSDKKF